MSRIRGGTGEASGVGSLDSAAKEEKALLGQTGLPPEVRGYLRAVMDESGMHGEARLDVLSELVTHFEDGLAAGRTAENLLDEFGDGKTLAGLIRRFRPDDPWTPRRLGRVGIRLADLAVGISQDLRHAVRGLRRNPAYTMVATLTLALGIGANTAVFSVVNGVLLRALPYPEADQLVVPLLTNPAENIRQGPVGYADYLRWREETAVFKKMGLYVGWNLNLTGEEHPERVRGAVVSDRFFEVLGAPPILGRTFAPEEHEPGGGRATILSQGLWERRFGGDPDVLGRSILLDGEAYEVVGVVPPEARWPREAEIWIPLTFGSVTPDWVLEMDARAYSIIARMQPGTGLPRAKAVVDQLARRAAADRPDLRAGFGATVIPLRTHVIGEHTQRALLLLMASVAFVLLIACANVANLTLERSLSAQREISIRAAIGAGRIRSVRPLAWECLIVTLMGGGLGILSSVWGMEALTALAPAPVPNRDGTEVNLGLLSFGLGLTLLTALAFTLAPTVTVRNLDLRRSLSDAGARGGKGAGGIRARSTLSVIQLALSAVLLFGATLTAKSTIGLLRSDPGIRGEGVLTMKVFLPHHAPDSPEAQATAALYRAFTEQLEALPAALSAAAVSALPLSAGGLFDNLPFVVGGEPEPGADDTHFANWNIVGVGFFQTLGISLPRGRAFSREDLPTSPKVAILSESFARELFPDRNPLGEQIFPTSGVVADDPLEVVGVAVDIPYTSLSDSDRNVVYVPQTQSAWREMAMVVRFADDPTARVDEVKEAIWSIDPSVPVTEIRTMQRIAAESSAASRFASTLVAIFAALALALAVVGVYGVTNVSLRHRYRELGVRRALGADGRDLGRLLLLQGAKLGLLGVVAGLPAGLLLTRLLSGLLYDVGPNDPVIFVTVSLSLALIAVAAGVLPARKASKVDPMEALKAD
jgi:predicted permease